MHVKLREARERTGISIEELVEKTNPKYRVRSVEQMESCGAGLSVNFIHTYVKYAGLDLEQLVHDYKNAPEPYASLIQKCLCQNGSEDKQIRKNMKTLEQYLADKEQITIHTKSISGKFLSIMLQMFCYGKTKEDYEKIIEYMEMVQQNEVPDVLKMSQEDALLYKRQLASQYKKKIDSIEMPKTQREALKPIYNRMIHKKAQYMFVAYGKQLTDAINEPFYRFAECNTVFFVNNRLLKADFEEFIKTSLTWTLGSIQIPYYEFLNLFEAVADADTPDKRYKVLDNIKDFQKRYKL